MPTLTDRLADFLNLGHRVDRFLNLFFQGVIHAPILVADPIFELAL